jgi:UDP-glucose:(heptosyl)LPS alpha-1,3-glucosyltransferase
MRIAFGIVSLFPGGGLQRDCLEIAKLVRYRGHDVTIYAERVSGDIQTGGIPVVTLANESNSNHGRQHQFAFDFQREANAQCDLTVGFNKMLGLDVLYCADASMYDRLRKQPYLNLLPRYRTFANMEKDCFVPEHKTKTILLSQNQLLEYWRTWRTEPQRMYLLPPTLSAARRKPEFRTDGTRQKMRASFGLSDQTWVWMTVGVQPNTKGTDRVIRALAEFPDARLLIAGLGAEDKAAQPTISLARNLGVAERVSWLGHREDMPQVMAAADLLLHPSRYDTTGTVILEGVVNGLPVIATEVCGYATHVTAASAGAVVAEPFDQGAFNAAVKSAQDPAVSAAWSKAGIVYGQRSGLSEGRQCAAQIILAAAYGKHPELAETAAVGLVPSGDEFAFDISALQPAQDSDWTAYFAAGASRSAAQ